MLAVAMVVLAGCAATPSVPDASAPLQRAERRGSVMGTDLVLTVRGADPSVLDAALDAAEAELRRVEDLMTDWRPSPLTTLNATAGTGPVKVPAELLAIVARALELARITKGAFDISYAGAGKLWDFKAVPPSLPSDAELTQALTRVGWRRVTVDADAGTISLPEGFRLGLGGIAKGYGVDRAMQVLRDRGIAHAVVNAGGDMKVLGEDSDGPWEVAVKHPRDRARVMGLLRLSNAAVVTSGDYERFFELDGRRYHHILDPTTGRPATGCMSATVTAPSAELADALATACCVSGPAAALRWAAQLPGVELLCVDMQGRIHRSSGFSNE